MMRSPARGWARRGSPEHTRGRRSMVHHLRVARIKAPLALEPTYVPSPRRRRLLYIPLDSQRWPRSPPASLPGISHLATCNTPRRTEQASFVRFPRRSPRPSAISPYSRRSSRKESLLCIAIRRIRYGRDRVLRRVAFIPADVARGRTRPCERTRRVCGIDRARTRRARVFHFFGHDSRAICARGIKRSIVSRGFSSRIR